jgi:hypothetical protein
MPNHALSATLKQQEEMSVFSTRRQSSKETELSLYQRDPFTRLGSTQRLHLDSEYYEAGISFEDVLRVEYKATVIFETITRRPETGKTCAASWWR